MSTPAPSSGSAPDERGVEAERVEDDRVEHERRVDERDLELARLRSSLAAVQNQQVERWLHLVRHGDVVPASIERSLSWRLTRPVRLAQTAGRVLRREGPNKFWAIARTRLRRLVRR